MSVFPGRVLDCLPSRRTGISNHIRSKADSEIENVRREQRQGRRSFDIARNRRHRGKRGATDEVHAGIGGCDSGEEILDIQIVRGKEQAGLWLLALERIGALLQDLFGSEPAVEFISLPHGHSQQGGCSNRVIR